MFSYLCEVCMFVVQDSVVRNGDNRLKYRKTSNIYQCLYCHLNIWFRNIIFVPRLCLSYYYHHLDWPPYWNIRHVWHDLQFTILLEFTIYFNDIGSFLRGVELYSWSISAYREYHLVRNDITILHSPDLEFLLKSYFIFIPDIHACVVKCFACPLPILRFLIDGRKPWYISRTK